MELSEYPIYWRDFFLKQCGGLELPQYTYFFLKKMDFSGGSNRRKKL
jgi:hypothetical protein